MPRLSRRSCGLPFGLACCCVRHAFPVDDGIADFAEGRYFVDHPDPNALSEEARRGMANENAGRRIEDYYLPILRATGARRVLDSGLRERRGGGRPPGCRFRCVGARPLGVPQVAVAYAPRRDRLVVADGLKLPFPDGFFDAVISSGVLEHVGVFERGGPGIYEVSPLPDRDERRSAFLAGLVRVLAPGGTLYLDFPNGAFPIDFWHGPTRRRSAMAFALRRISSDSEGDRRLASSPRSPCSSPFGRRIAACASIRSARTGTAVSSARRWRASTR